MSDQIISGSPSKVAVTSATFSAKFQSKREVYLFLTIDCEAYLPNHGQVTI